MQCPVCNQEVNPQAAFCNHCGAAISTAPPQSAPPADFPPSYAAAQVPPPAAYPPPAASSGLSDNSAAALAYVTIIPAIIFLIIEPYNKIPLVRFHSMQCIGLAVVSVVLQILVSILGGMLHFIPVLGAIVSSLLHLVVFLGIFIAWLMCIIKASKGEWFKLPVIGDFAAKQANS